MNDQHGQHPEQPAPEQSAAVPNPSPEQAAPFAEAPPAAAPAPLVPPAAADERQWVQVPTAPPHPYGAAPTQPRGGKALAVTSMALGLVALLSALVFGFYFNLFVFAAALLGLGAVVLGIIALVKHSRPKGAGVTGIITGALSMVIALVLGTFGMIALSTSLVNSLQNQGSGQGEGPDSSDSWTPDTEPEALIEWPSNMASGGIVFTGSGGAPSGSTTPVPLSSDPLQPGTSPAPHEVDREHIADVLIYVDYRCPHCMAFEQSNGAFLESLLLSGDATVEIVPLSFLDRASAGSYYSSRAAGAMVCLTSSQPEAAWRAHTALLSPEVQPGQGPGFDNSELVAVLDDAASGLTAEARSCIESERFVTFAQALNNWVFANPVPNASDQNARVAGTPSVYVNGELYEGPTTDAAAFEAFYQEKSR